MGDSDRKTKAPTSHRAAPDPSPSGSGMASARPKAWSIALVAVLAGVPLAMGKYFELSIPDPFDSGGYVYSAKRVLDGARIGVDEKPSARPGTLLVNLLGVALTGYNETGVKLVQGVLQAAALAMLFAALLRAFGSVLAAGTAAIVASAYLSAPVIAKLGNVKEQYVVATAAMAISCVLLRQCGGRWWWAMLAGALAAWSSTFKATGMSVIAAIGLFVLAQPLLKHRTWRQTGADLALLLTGAALGLAPVFMWLLAADAQGYWPYSWLVNLLLPSGRAALSAGYVGASRQLVPFAEQVERVLRYYGLLSLPVVLGAGAVAVRVLRGVLRLAGQRRAVAAKPYDRFVLLLGLWWLGDMALVWVSPRSYEQYYLPLTASGAVLGAYVLALYAEAWTAAEGPKKALWNFVGLAGLLAAIIMAWPVFFGLTHSPHSGLEYPQRSRGYLQKFEEIDQMRREGGQMPWQTLGEHIRDHSTAQDTMYVWGWYPGIYVAAQRVSCVPNAFTSEMHVLSPQQLTDMVGALLERFTQARPKFLVDSRKVHFPWNRPPLLLWPLTREGPIPPDPAVVADFEQGYYAALDREIGHDEAERFKAMKPFRDYVMRHYRPVQAFGPHILFERKEDASQGRP